MVWFSFLWLLLGASTAQSNECLRLFRTKAVDLYPQEVRVPSSCCRPVQSGSRLIQAEKPIAGTRSDPYYSGGSRFPIQNPAPHPSDYGYSAPPILKGRSISLGVAQIPSTETRSRLLREAAEMGMKESNFTFAGEGAFSEVFFIHALETPMRLLTRAKALEATSSGEAIRILQDWAKKVSRKVLKVRRIVLSDEGVKKVNQAITRDFGLNGLASQLTKRANFRGKPLVRVARIESTPAQMARRVFEQEAISGIKVSTLHQEIEVILRSRSNSATQTNGELERVAKALGVLKSNGFESVEDVVARVSALEQFYRDTHFDVLAFQRVNRIKPLQNKNAGRKRADIGFDYNHGENVIWDPVGRMFVMIDW